MGFNPRAPYGARPALKELTGDGEMSFNPRAPYGARLEHLVVLTEPLEVSIHAPRTGRDNAAMTSTEVFQSTRPVRGATSRSRRQGSLMRWVSIHAPRTGRDCWQGGRAPARSCFNPRAPYGARQSRAASPVVSSMFQSTRPVRGATPCSVRRTLRSAFTPAEHE